MSHSAEIIANEEVPGDNSPFGGGHETHVAEVAADEEVSVAERDLVMRLIEGDEDAFCELYVAYKNRLIYFAMYFLRSRDYAEDVYQEAFAAIWKGRSFIDPDIAFSRYLYTIVRNRVFNQLRDQEREAIFYEQLLREADAEHNDTYRAIFSDDLHRLLVEAIAQLTPRQREIFELSRVNHLSHKEIADKLGISVSTVSSSITTSLATIRAYLSKHAGGSADLILLLLCLNSSQILF